VKKTSTIYEKVVEINERIRPLQQFEAAEAEKDKIILGTNGEKFLLEQALDVEEVRS
jgi:hypothetical protein